MPRGYFLALAQQRPQLRFVSHQERSRRDSGCSSAVRLQEPAELFLAVDFRLQDRLKIVRLSAAIQFVSNRWDIVQALVRSEAVVNSRYWNLSSGTH